MKKIGGLLLIGMLALTACSAPAPQAATAPLAADAASTIAPAPIPAATAAAKPTASAGGEDIALFLKSARFRWTESTASDDELVAAGRLACIKMRAGTDVTEVQVVTGGTTRENLAVAVAAQDGLCRDTIPAPPKG